MEATTISYHREHGSLSKSARLWNPPRAFAIGLLSLLWLLSPQPSTAQDDNDFQVIRGKHIVLKADEGSQQSLQLLVDAFEAAVPQWAAFWGLRPEQLNDWTVDAFVMSDKQRFRDTGDLPTGFNFPYGYATNGNIWAVRQPSEYYTRHLLLHEGAHALAIHLYGGTGPSWFAEGIAELLSVHTGTGSDVKINQVPLNRQAVPYWGRFKLMSRRRTENRIPTLESILDYPIDLKSDVESYGWSWAAMMLFTQHPEYRERVLQAAQRGADHTKVFTNLFKREIASSRPIIDARWRLLTHTVNYGFNWSGERVELSIKDPLWNGRPLSVDISAKAGWQSCGVRFPPGMNLSLQASGKCVLDAVPKPWESEPQGITIEYADGRPLGQLVVGILPNKTTEQRQLNPLEIIEIAPNATLQTTQHCWLMFRINDHLDKRTDNRGSYRVELSRARK